MGYTIKLTKAQKEQFKKEILDKMDSLEGEELKKAKAVFDEFSEYKKSGHISQDEFLTILKAKLLNDQYCRQKFQEVMELNIAEYDINKAVQDFLKTKQLPSDPELRIKVLQEQEQQILERKRELITKQTGTDPEPKFLGKSEDGKENIYEIYLFCPCGKIFKTFKNAYFCSEKCRRDWVSKKLPETSLVQEIWSERNCESWDWERIGSYSDATGQHGIFKRVFKS